LTAVRPRVEAVDATGEGTTSNAAGLRLKLRREGRNISLVDALGYTLTKRLVTSSLTGDREFKGLPGVEHVKHRCKYKVRLSELDECIVESATQFNLLNEFIQAFQQLAENVSEAACTQRDKPETIPSIKPSWNS